jgi:hypothetical protein
VRTIRTAATLTASGLLATLVACSGGGDGAARQGHAVVPTLLATPTGRTPVQAVEAAALAVDKEGSAKVVLVSEPPGRARTTLQGSTAWKIKPAADLAVTGGSTLPSRMILLDGVMYGLNNEEQARAAGGKHWVKVDPAALVGLGGSGAKAAAGARTATAWGQQLNPGSDLRGLARAARVELVGPEKLDGAGTMRYRCTAMAADLIDAEDALTPEQRSSLLGELVAEGGSSVTVDLWIDDESRLLRAVEQTETAGGTDVSTTTYSDYGTEVNIQAPPLEDTADLAESLRSAS